ncbi:hypothetical protein M3Y97_00158700 [Aphelenchoides bicaudatus]|nr:hypothetical protein M3Y97_00158700 [Aphelenchoides bicaudatus]
MPNCINNKQVLDQTSHAIQNTTFCLWQIRHRRLLLICDALQSASGGTVCDPSQQRCLCPYGTVANLETLSCVPTSELHSQNLHEEINGQSETGEKTARPGESCSNNEKCVGNSYCLRSVGTCLCPNELESFNGQCLHPSFAKHRLPKVPLGAACGNMVICDYGSHCLNGMCQCQMPSIEHSGRCVEYVLPRKQVEHDAFNFEGPGELCNQGEICGKGSICDLKIPVCVCPPGTDLDNGACMHVRTSFAGLNTFYTKPNKVFPDQQQTFAKYGPMMPAHNNEKTPVIYPTLAQYGPTQHRQQIYPNQQYASQQRIMQQTTYAPQISTRPSNPFQVCAYNQLKLICKFQLTSNKKLNVGDTCSMNKDCDSNAYCDGSKQPPKCQCLATHVDISGKCEKIIYPGQTGCFEDRQCDAAYPLSRCLNRQCVCPLGTKEVEQLCVPGAVCDVNDLRRHCPAGATCLDSECQCVSPLFAYENRCLSRGELYLADNQTLKCQSNQECPLEFECSAKTGECICPEGTYRFSSRCIPIEPAFAAMNNNQLGMEDPRESNERTEPLDIEAALLSRETAESLEKIFNVLMKLNLAGDLNGVDGTDDNKIQKKEKAIDENQQVAEDYQVSNQKMIDLADEESPVDFVPQSREIKRQKRMSPEVEEIRFYDESCTSDEACTNGSVCINKTCQCKPGFVLKNENCVQINLKPLNTPCISNVDQCAGGGSCQRGLCVCTDGSVEHQKRCRQKIGGKCSNNEHCSNGSKCMADTLRCECPPGRQLTADHSCIVKVARAGDPCLNAELCSMGSFCKNGICSCLEQGFVLRNRRCLKVNQLKPQDVQQKTKATTNSNTQSAKTIINLATTQTPIIQPLSESISNQKHKVVLSLMTRSLQNNETAKTKEPNPEQQQKMAFARPPRPSQRGSSKQRKSLSTLILTAKPGELCDNRACTGGSICRDSICECADDETIQDDKCTSDGQALQDVVTPQRAWTASVSKDLFKSNKIGLLSGESHCFYGICVCLYGLVNTNSECSSSEVLRTAAPGDSCALGQNCGGGSTCIQGICECNKDEYIDENNHCRERDSQPMYTYTGSGSSKMSSHKNERENLIYGSGAPEEGRFNQILTAKQMSINVVDLDTLKALVSGQFVKTPQAGERCEEYCGNGARCVRGLCECPDGGYADQNGYCHQQTDTAGGQPTGNEVVDTQQAGTDSTIGQSQDNYMQQLQQLQQQQNGNNFYQIQQLPPAATFINIPNSAPSTTTYVGGVPGSYCMPGSYCYGGGAMCGSNGVCICRPGYRLWGNQCQISRVPLGEQCYLNEQCDGNGLCLDGTCACSRGTPVLHRHRHRCPERPDFARPGEDCSASQACMSGSICSIVSGVCECPIGSQTIIQHGFGECQQARRPRGPFCISSANCHRNTYCDNGFCMCKFGFTPVENVCLPTPRAVIDERSGLATNNIQIYPQKAIRSHHSPPKSRPDNTSAKSKAHSRRPQRALPGEFCNKSRVCVGQSRCVHSFCKCPDGTRNNGQRCVLAIPIKRPIPSASLRRAPITRPEAANKAKTLTEQEEFKQLIENEKTILPTPPPLPSAVKQAITSKLSGIKAPLSPTSFETQRWQNERPIQRTPFVDIEVEPMGTERKRIFPPFLSIGQTGSLFEHDRRFAASLLDNIRRAAKSARLGMGLMAAPQKHYGMPFDNCELNDDCFEGSKCSRKAGLGYICVCLPDRVYFMGICIKRRDNIQVAALNQKCTPAEVCGNGSECVNSFCRCPSDREERGGFCIRVAQPGDSCLNGEFCALNAVCKSDVGACVCPNDSRAVANGCEFEAEEKKNETLHEMRKGLPGDLCDVRTVCVNGSYCSGFGFCHCGELYTEVYSMCIATEKVKMPGDNCTSEDHVCSANSWCHEGKCRCLNGYEPFRGRCRNNYLQVNTVANNETKPNVQYHWRSQHLSQNVDDSLIDHYELQQHPAVNNLSNHIKIYKLEHTCRANTECPPGAYCMYNRCFCNSLPLQNKTSPTATTCVIDSECMHPLTCMNGRCVCIQDLSNKPTTTTKAPAKVTTTIHPTELTIEALLASTQEPTINGIKNYAECVQRRCICIDRKKSIVLRNGLSVCEFTSGDHSPRPTDSYHRRIFGRLVTTTQPMPTDLAAGERCEFSAQCRRNFICLEGRCICIDAVDDTSCKEEDKRPRGKVFTIIVALKKRLQSKFRLADHVPTEKLAEVCCGTIFKINVVRPLDRCAGGSICIDNYCLCPAGMAPSTQGVCEVRQTQAPTTTVASVVQAIEEGARPHKHDECSASGLYCRGGTICLNRTCQCPLHATLINDQCVSLGTPYSDPCLRRFRHHFYNSYTTYPKRMQQQGFNFARPLESCAEGQICTGGSVCQQKTRCVCPNNKPHIRNYICSGDESAGAAKNPWSCELARKCPENSFCNGNECECEAGYTRSKDKCIHVPKILSVQPTTPSSKQTVDKDIAGPSVEELVRIQQAQLQHHLRQLQIEQQTKQPTPNVQLSTKNSTARPQTNTQVQIKEDKEEAQKSTTTQAPTNQVPNQPHQKLTQNNMQTNKQHLISQQIAQIPTQMISRQLVQQPAHQIIQIPLNQLNRLTQIPLMLHHHGQQVINLAAQPAMQQHPVFLQQHIHQPMMSPVSRKQPRISGPRLQRPSKTSSGDKKELAEADRRAVCPPGNNPLFDEESEGASHKFAMPGTMCDKKQQCLGGSICDKNNQMCKCAAGHEIRRQVCSLKNATTLADIGESCVDDNECSGSSVCREQKCACTDSMEKQDGGYCTRLVGRKHFSSMKFQPALPIAAQRCPMQPYVAASCALPDCFCSRSGREPPPGLTREQLPQIVVLTFDDPVNAKSMRDYRHLFEQLNPINANGCPVRGTFYISHEWTNYNDVQWLAMQGHELASNSISHRLLTGLGVNDWLVEMDGQRQILAKFANIDESQIVGMRAPQFGLGGDAQFIMAKNAGFLYDNSISVDPGIDGEPYWPQTLDYGVPFKCENEYCPRSSIPGFWVIPNNVFHGSTEHLRSPMLQGILTGSESAEEVLYFMYRNFNRAYSTNRAPFIVNLNAEFMQAYGGIGMTALENFINLVRQNNDVYFMTMRELVDWLRAPLPIEVLRSKASNCLTYMYSATPPNRLCLQPNKCLYSTPGLGSAEHQFLTCNRCPMNYPWTENPQGILYNA